MILQLLLETRPANCRTSAGI